MNRLKQVRLALGMKQIDLADASVISQAGLSRMESEDYNLSGDSLLKLCQTLNVSADYLIGLIDDPRPVREGAAITLQEFALLEAYRKGDIKRVLRLLVEDGNGGE